MEVDAGKGVPEANQGHTSIFVIGRGLCGRLGFSLPLGNIPGVWAERGAAARVESLVIVVKERKQVRTAVEDLLVRRGNGGVLQMRGREITKSKCTVQLILK